MTMAIPPAEALQQSAIGERDRRAAETATLLAAGSRAVVRLSARMPATLRQRGLAAAPTERGVAVFESACRERGRGDQGDRYGRGQNADDTVHGVSPPL